MARVDFINRYDRVAQFLHWAIAVLLLGQWLLAEAAASAELRVQTLALLGIHKSFGITILVLAILRLSYRFVSYQPRLPEIPDWQRRVSSVVHGLFYTLLFTLPLTGWLGSSASAYSVSWFNLFVLPDMVTPNEKLKEIFFTAHLWSWRLLYFLAAAHVAAAIKHHLFARNNVLRQMWGTTAVLAGTISAASIYMLWPAQAGIETESSPLNTEQGATGGTAYAAALLSELQGKGLKEWQIDYENSEIVFQGDQAGAGFTGKFEQWQSEIYINPDKPEDGLIITSVKLESVNTNDGERDSTLLEEAFFSTSLFPQALFTARDFREIDEADYSGLQYEAGASPIYSGQSYMKIKGLEHQVSFYFRLYADGDTLTLKGQSRLNRLTLKIGTGEWADPSWIGEHVEVSVLVKALLSG